MVGRYQAVRNTDYYANFDYAVEDTSKDHFYVAGFPTRSEAQYYADYLNDHDYGDYTPYVKREGPPLTTREADKTLKEVYEPAMAQLLNSKSILLDRIERTGKRSLLDRILRRKRKVTLRVK